MTLRLSALFETRCDVVRRAYAMDNDMNPHWTRGKSKQLVNIQLHGIYCDSSKKPISINSNFPKIKKEETVNNSPRKSKLITLNQFVKRPQTRSSRNEIENRSSSPEASTKKSKYEMNGYSNSEDEDEETKPALNDIKRTRPNRKTVKRKMYGFEESDDENIADTKRSKRKLLPRVKIGRLKNKTESLGHTTRSSRNKTTVNYCDDYYDEFSEDEIENENPIKVKRERDSTDNSNVSEESENEKPIVTISSRGRMRKSSRKFPFF